MKGIEVGWDFYIKWWIKEDGWGRRRRRPDRPWQLESGYFVKPRGRVAEIDAFAAVWRWIPNRKWVILGEWGYWLQIQSHSLISNLFYLVDCFGQLHCHCHLVQALWSLVEAPSPLDWWSCTAMRRFYPWIWRWLEALPLGPFHRTGFWLRMEYTEKWMSA